MIAVLLALALAHAKPTPMAYEYHRAERATGIPVLCFPTPVWKTVEHRLGDGNDNGIYLYQQRTILLQGWNCQELAHWRTVRDPYLVSYAIWVLGHEKTHDDQFVAGRPFNEHEADCGGLAKFRTLRARLGIPARFKPPFSRADVGC